MSNIWEIAKKAEVSIATVSHVINKTRYVSPELTAKVEKVIKALDYKPNIIAGSLRSKKTKTIGLILPDSSNMVFSKIGQVIEVECAKVQQNVIFCNSSYNVDLELRNVDVLRMKTVDGIIILPASNRTDCIEKLLKIDIPFVVVNANVMYPSIDVVLVDNETLAYKATEHLIEFGRKAIGYLDRKLDHHYSIDRRNGFIKAMEKHGLDWNNKYYIRSRGFSYENGYEAMAEILKSRDKPDAIFSYNDIHAIGAIRAIIDQGLKVPQDISIIGCDNIPVAQFLTPSLTTMEYPTKELGTEACRLLMERIKNPDKKGERVVLGSRLIIRESTKEH
ncbi:LacI family transcriptional regulator [Candidatus Atribacteria bacterium HGW-Atribacteria-1]|nr:MAG: LacI family transcriptional regulator [Candidatus Atribacteria bacterium HGW-Atribacteria-1]